MKLFNKLKLSDKSKAMLKTVLPFIIGSALIYSMVLGVFGVFGDTVQTGVLYFVKNILPVVGILFGYFLIVFIPVRIIQAKDRNRQIMTNRINDQKLQEFSDNEKETQKKILEMLTKEETL